MTNERQRDFAEATVPDHAGGQKVFGRYTLIKVLGRGGMGIVWLARDEELERDVALKFLPDLIVLDRALLGDLKRETRRSLELTHRNIVRIYDFVQSENSACISMEYIDGDTLSNLRAEKEHKVFEPNELSSWTSQLCDALDYAHNHARIIHRDLKPANLMLNQRGDLKVSDFGIARSLGDSMSKLTMASGTSGTLTYMSPQQFDGERGTHLDDIYSLGATLYDLLTSKPPFYSGNVDRQIHERVAPSMTERRKEFNIEPAFVPPVWEETVAACLAKDPAKRPQSTAEVAQRLHLSAPQARTVAPIERSRLSKKALLAGAAAALVLILFAGAYLGFWKHQAAPPVMQPGESIPEKSIAVLPFENLSPEKDDAFFADGIQDDVLSSLGKFKDLKVIARSSVMIYRGASVAGKLREIGQTLQVSHVLEGSVRRAANRVVLNVALIDTRNDRQVWSQRYDRTLSDTLSLQGELALEIARELRATLTPSEQRVAMTKPTENPDAYLLYLKALERHGAPGPSNESLIAAVELYTQAIALDPKFALAHARASMANNSIYFFGDQDPTRRVQARARAEEAIRISPTLPEGHLALGIHLFSSEKNYEAALKEFSIASAAAPNNTEVLSYTAVIYRRQGRWREAIATFQRAQDLDPRNRVVFNQAAFNYVLVRDWSAATACYYRALEIAPDAVISKLGLAYLEVFQTGDPATGQAALVKFGQEVSRAGWDFSMMARDFAKADSILAQLPKDADAPDERTFRQVRAALARGDVDFARALLEPLRPISEAAVRDHPDEARYPAFLSLLYAYLGRKEEAIREARRAIELEPESKNAYHGPITAAALALVYAQTGEADQAITLIEHLLSVPGAVHMDADGGASITQAELRLRWEWDPLRDDPRFQKILEGPEPKTIY